MDRGKKPLKAIVGEWTTIHKKPNKGMIATNSKKEFVSVKILFYTKQGYYKSYPMVNQPIGTSFSLTPKRNKGSR